MEMLQSRKEPTMSLTISRTTSIVNRLCWRHLGLAAGLGIATAVFVGLGRQTDVPRITKTPSHIAAPSITAVGDNPVHIVYIVGSETQKTDLAQLAQAEIPYQPEFVVSDRAQQERYLYRAEDIPANVRVIDLRYN
jgi:hypothetical protein